MKQSSISSRLRILPTMLLVCLSAVAQPQQETAVKQELALSVERKVAQRRGNNFFDRPWEIPAFNGGSASGSAENFKRLESWKPSKDEAAVTYIDIKIGREGDLVIAHLSVRLENEKEVAVGTYRLREGQTIRTEEFTKFGFEPVVLKVIKAKPSFKDPLLPITPLIENKTKAIEVVGFHKDEHPFDGFLLTLRNNSDKNIVALDLFIPSSDGNGGQGERAQGDKNHPVMLPGGIEVRHISISRGGRTTSEGDIPDPQLQQTLIIRTVVFDDGTYEGHMETAAEIEAGRRGLDIQRRRILPLLLEPKETGVSDVHTTLSDLREQAYALNNTADASVALELMARFPSLDGKSKEWLTQSVEGGMREGKLEFLRFLKDFDEMLQRPGERPSLAQWIKHTKATYETLTTTF